MSNNYFIMLSDPPWAGPNAFRVAGSSMAMNKGRKPKEIIDAFQFELRVDVKAEQPLEFPPLDWHDPPGGQPLFSTRMIQVFQSLGIDNIDYYPALVKYLPTNTACDYCVSNILGIVSGLDYDKSEVQMDEDGFVFGVSKIVFDDSKFRESKIVRLKEYLNLIVISRAVKDEIERVGLTGVKVIEDSMWQPGMI